MVTGQYVREVELRKFCNMFGFDFEKHLRFRRLDKTVGIMHGLISNNPNGFYEVFLKNKSFWFKEDPGKRAKEAIISELRKMPGDFISHTSGGSGMLNWGEMQEKAYGAYYSISEGLAVKLFAYPKYADIREVQAAAGSLAAYIPKYIPMLKFLAFIKFIYPEWKKYLDECRRLCQEMEWQSNTQKFRELSWHWEEGEVSDRDHAVIIHECIHNILNNSRVAPIEERIGNAWNEGIDVFFHRLSGLHMGFYKKGFLKRYPRNYWQASEIFKKAFEDYEKINGHIAYTIIPEILQKKEQPLTASIIGKLNKKWPDNSFHSKD